jgi:hypothetical protein
MKVYIGPFPTRCVSRIHTNYMNKKYGRYEWEKNHNKFETLLDKLEDSLQWVYNHTINLFLDKRKRAIKIKLHPYDTWGADHTLSLIILPIIKQLKSTKHGTPWVPDEDVPAELKIRSVDAQKVENGFIWDANCEKRWEWVLGEIEWTFEQLVDQEKENQFFSGGWFDKNGGEVKIDSAGLKAYHDRVQNGLILFGKHFRNLWD